MTRSVKSWSNFVLYYGSGLENVLATFDLIILEAGNQKPQFIRQLNASGKTPIAYISGFEYLRSQPDAENLWKRYGLGVNSIWKPSWTDNYLMDLRRKDWQEIVAGEMQRVMDIGYRGVFLDTLGVCQMPELNQLTPHLLDELVLAATGMIYFLRSCFPDAVIVQNCGLNQLKEMTAPYIDAICWESFRLGLVEGPATDAWSIKQVKELQQLSAEHGIKVLLLAEDSRKYEQLPMVNEPQEHTYYSCRGELCQASYEYFPLKAAQERFARDHNFLLYEAPRHYMAGVYK